MSALEFNIANQDLIKIAIAVVCGGLLGLERQYKNKTAGFRTIILICLGSTIYTMVAQRAGAGVNINIVTGIGFIGAGVIFKDNIAVSGLTTAAVIWISAAIGMADGSGNYLLALVCTVLTLMVLLLFNLLERYIDKVHRDKLFVIVFTNSNYDNMTPVEEAIATLQLTSRRVQVSKKDGCLQFAILVTGHRQNISKLDEKLLQMDQVKSF
ncbi:MgtC/SapB family protein [Mucilaginibacter sp. OK098]|uniref:MgtC/SapB family protein n=1 Tax=Mucilaginibacter sp. OK098 TaxID=1855297 RepID=UPI00091102A7|nr:MgtC/SapB family protein [Mucilaginibacter sp. OK098]SHL99890.1 putative Mg2+ transporter-C (MgtC) family protein [Mucilaginibacter sp. OK098]